MGKEIWRFNRGEWTEAYVFLKLLSEGKIFSATEDLKKATAVSFMKKTIIIILQ